MEHAQAIAGAHHLDDEMRRGLAFKTQFLERAEAGVHHQGEIERLIRFRLEALDLLRQALFAKLEGVLRQVEDGPPLRSSTLTRMLTRSDFDANARPLRDACAEAGRPGSRKAQAQRESRQRLARQVSSRP